MPDDLKLLPPPEKKVAAKVLVNEGYSTRDVEELLGVDHVTVSRYAKQETPDEMKRFETQLTNIFAIKEHQIAAKALRRIDSKIDTAIIMDALEIYKSLRGKNVSGINVQVNNFNADKYLEKV